LADKTAAHSDFIRPGHVFPLIADKGGLAVRKGHTEAGVALAQLVGAQPLALLSEIVNEDGSMARGQALKDFADAYSIPMLSIEELVSIAPVIEDVKSEYEFQWVKLPLRGGAWKIATFPGLRQREHAVLSFGLATTTPLVRIHSECFTGDVVHSQRCDCGEQLEQSITLIQKHGYGFVVYMRDHEGRGIGLAEKINAYQLQDEGMDTVEANVHLGHEIDARDWSDAIAIIQSLGLSHLHLLTNNPKKVAALQNVGIAVVQSPLVIASNEFNEKYLATKQEKLGHTRGGK
jgi:3,4-dihydroxy 2-butanone 4-phosphate synthase/GTP cyclohydrolase II